MQHNDDEPRRGQKRPAESTRDADAESAEQPGAILQNVALDPNALTVTEAKDFPQSSKDFGTKSFEPGEIKVPIFSQGEPLRWKSSDLNKLSSTSARPGDTTTKPSTSLRQTLFPETKQVPSLTSAGPSSDFRSEPLLMPEQFSVERTPTEQVLSHDCLSTLKDTHDSLAALFPAYKRYLNEGFSGIGDGGTQYVPTHAENSEQDLGFFSKPACFTQPEDEPDAAPSESTNTKITGSDSIYPGSRISIHDSILSILTFAQTEKLTGAALTRLLLLIDIHCPAKNNLVKSSDKLFNHLDYLNSPFELSYYCSMCWRARMSAQDLCDVCSDPQRKVHFFVHFSLADQLKHLFKRPQFIEALKYRETRCKKNNNAIEDIIDGQLYQEALKGFLANPNNLSMMWYTDGVQMFESTSYSIWPQFFVILELPPDQRYKPENMLLAGLWGSKDHPHPNVVLKHIVNDLLDLKESGVEVQLPNNETKLVKVCCLCGTCDSPAKAAFMNLKGHAGYYSCPVCFIKGLKSEASENVMVFPPEQEVVFRSVYEGYSNLVDNSLKDHKDPKSKDEACKGVQGPTLLSLMFHLCMFKSVGIDSMHCLYGLVKQFCHIWFDSKFKSKPFSLHEKLDEINMLLSNIQLPQFVQRLPLPVDKLSLWKASLCFNFFFHMMLPVLETAMSQEYFEHLLLLVDSVSLLNSSSVSPSDLEEADFMLCKFVNDFYKLYNVRHMSLNLHLSRHLSSIVKNLGPLWATSCFPFEDFNGKLINLAHGTSDSLIQISRRFPILAGLSTEIDKMSEGPAKEFCEQLVQKWKRYHIKEQISEHSFVIGFFDQSVILYSEISEMLQTLYQFVPKFHTFPKVYHNKQLFVASSYKKTVRKSSAVKYLTSEGVNYGELLTFVKVEKGNYYAYIKRFNVMPFVPTSPRQVSYIVRVSGNSNYDFVLVQSLQAVCFYITVEETSYISNVLNKFERF